ncbi:hypothetical protein LMG8286_01279 [Campylobacter suis]|uniref:Autotransporter domain-containing protein n=1 Tax=Campylobacter suis TaxID=2790657 RepID=A0ABM8Q648_9BACT|nr:autotransporter outer membrane beta-barrel domain-containing protein [Campylobacter suis]CAD7288384.1 hypothetical protein LMG8286_01279 [Campylobacter suis]
MKISKIACMAILVSSINVGAFASVGNLMNIYRELTSLKAHDYQGRLKVVDKYLKEIANSSPEDLQHSYVSKNVSEILSTNLELNYKRLMEDTTISKEEKERLSKNLINNVNSFMESGKALSNHTNKIKSNLENTENKASELGFHEKKSDTPTQLDEKLTPGNQDNNTNPTTPEKPSEDKKTEDPKNTSSNKFYNAMSKVKGNEYVDAIMALPEAKRMSVVSEIERSVSSTATMLSRPLNIDIIRFSSTLNTNTRLAKLSNPYNDEFALTYAVSNLSSEKFADGGDTLSGVVKAYTDRFNTDNNLWANVIGAKGKIKNEADAKLYGFSIGYDKAFDDSILGAFATYAKSKSDATNVELKSDNYEFGVYARKYIGANEIDTKIAVGTVRNKLDRASNKSKFDSKFADISLDYGYVFDISNDMF